MVSDTYQSYDGSPKSFTNAQNGAISKVRPTSPVVYMPETELDVYVQTQLAAIRVDMTSNFLYPYSHIWPECINHDDVHDVDQQVVQVNEMFDDNEEKVDGDVQEEQEQEQSSDNDVGELMNVNNPQQGDEDGVDNGPDPDHSANPLDQRSWEAWGTINQQNQMVGKRKTAPVKRFVYDQRRRGGQFPDPKV
jgi:hypothetical protein